MGSLTDYIGSIEFAKPLYLWIAIGLIILLLFLPWFGEKRGLSLELGFWKKEVAFKSRRISALLIPVVLTLAIIAGASSYPGTEEKQITYIYGYPVMVVVDISGSMGAGIDLHTGYEESIEVFSDLVDRRGDINFSLLLYSAENYIARYFVNKNELFRDTLENKDEIMQIANGTRPAEALLRARRFLAANIPRGEKTIVFISDLNVSGQAGIDITEEMTRVLMAGINLYVVVTGEEELRSVEMPEISGWKIVEASDKNGVNQMCEEISSRTMSVVREDEKSTNKSMIPPFVISALVLIGFYLVLSETRFQKIP